MEKKNNDSVAINKDFLNKRKNGLFFRLFAFIFAGLASQGVVFFLGFFDDLIRFIFSLFLWVVFYFFLIFIFFRWN